MSSNFHVGKASRNVAWNNTHAAGQAPIHPAVSSFVSKPLLVAFNTSNFQHLRSKQSTERPRTSRVPLSTVRCCLGAASYIWTSQTSRWTQFGHRKLQFRKENHQGVCSTNRLPASAFGASVAWCLTWLPKAGWWMLHWPASVGLWVKFHCHAYTV
jgi:hypothetical protein